MPESEQSFADRVQKSRELHDACNGFEPPFAAPPDGVTLPQFNEQTDLAHSLTGQTDDAAAAWSDAVSRRVETADTIKTTATQLLNYIKSGTAWRARFTAAKRFADAIRGIKNPRKPLPPPPAGEAPAKRRERGGQSYAELEQNWRGLVILCENLPGFAPTDAKIQLATLNDLLGSIKALNLEISTDEADLSEAQQRRYAAFFTEQTGLADMFQSVKTSVKGQYGTSSTQWGQVKAMKW